MTFFPPICFTGWRFRGWVMVASVLVLAGCVSSPAPNPAPTTDVKRLQAWKDAEALAAQAPGRFTVIGEGNSMLPVYGPKTVLVLQKVEFEALKAGMNVAYTNRNDMMVVHRLVSREKNGWRVIGLNNEVEDRERVTPYSLLGVVYAAFAHEEVE